MFSVIWHNAHACGTLAAECETYEQAEQIGRDWLYEMIAIDGNPAEAEQEYCYEIKEH